MENINPVSSNFGVQCHTHRRGNPLSVHLKQKLVDSIFRKQEVKWVKSVKKLVSDLKGEFLADIANSSRSCTLTNIYPDKQDASSGESTATFPLTLSELEDSSEVEYELDQFEVHYEKFENVDDEYDNAAEKKRKFGDEIKALSHKRKRSDILDCYNYDTPTHSSSPLKRNRIAKALSFSSCSGESDESVVENEDGSEEQRNFSPNRKRWSGMASLDIISESPESVYSGETLDLQSNSRDTSPDLPSDFDSVTDEEIAALSRSPKKYFKRIVTDCRNIIEKANNGSIHAAEESDFNIDPVDDFEQSEHPTFRMYDKSFSCMLETIFEGDEEEEEEEKQGDNSNTNEDEDIRAQDEVEVVSN